MFINAARFPLTEYQKDGLPKVLFSIITDDYAAAYWAGDFWAYVVPEGGALEPIGFIPTHYCEDA